jgi:hypothetical protein
MEGEMLSSDEIKRQIIKSTNTSIIKKKMDEKPPGISEDEQIEIGQELEKMTRTPGWAIAEQYMLNKMNLIGLATQNGSDVDKGVAKGFIEFMQWITLCIKRAESILEKEKLKYEAKNVSKDKADKDA